MVSISPFGLYKPGEPDGMPAPIVGTDPYTALYADTLRWMEEGWLDMLVPQIYWDINSSGQPYIPILEWWLDNNPHNKLIVAGSALYKTEPSWDWDMQEMVDQIEATRELEDRGANGNCMFSAKYFRDDYKDCVSVFKGTYPTPVPVVSTPAYRGREGMAI